MSLGKALYIIIASLPRGQNGMLLGWNTWSACCALYVAALKGYIFIDDVTCDIEPGSMRTHHRNIHCSFARQFVHACIMLGQGMCF